MDRAGRAREHVDALEELRQMHIQAKEAFHRIEGAPPDQRAGLWAKLRPELELHEKIEEQFVYDPVARDVGPRDETLKAWDGEHEQQAQEADGIIARIGELDAKDGRWITEFETLVTMMDRHIAHEEQDIWPKIRQEWGEDKLERAGRPVSVAKAAAMGGASVSEAFGRAMETAKDAF